MSTLYLNLTDAILTGQGHWDLAYNFTSFYNVSDVSAKSVYYIAEQIKANNTAMLTQYYSAYSVLYNTNMSTCDNTCRITQYCTIAAVDLDQFRKCTTDFDAFCAETDGTHVVATRVDLHATEFTANIPVLMYALSAAAVVLCTIMFAVCAFRTQQLHLQYKYATVSRAHSFA